MSLFPPPARPQFDIGHGEMTPDPVIMRTGRTPASVYTSNERFDYERQLFGEVWLYAGRVERIPKSGDWFVRNVDVRQVSAIVVRGKDGQVRAFHNICSHRGMKLAWNESGQGGKFSCPYHGWLFDAEGKLANLPNQDCFPDVDTSANGLQPIACDTWEGFIFINLSGHPRQTLREFLGPLAARLGDAPFGDYPLTATISQNVDANWKMGMEAASEGYHVQALHKKSVGRMLATPENPHVNFLDWEPLGPHRKGTVPGNPEFAISPHRPMQLFAFMGADQFLPGAEGQVDKPKAGFFTHPDVNRIGSNLTVNEQYTLFPNFSIHLSLSGWWTTSYWPLDKRRAYWETTYYYRKPQSHREMFARHYGLALQRDIFTEDNSCFQKQQWVLESGALPAVHFGENEILLRHLNAVITTAYDASREEASLLAAD